MQEISRLTGVCLAGVASLRQPTLIRVTGEVGTMFDITHSRGSAELTYRTISLIAGCSVLNLKLNV